ncbi:uncharacterized protein LOC132200509 isoform X2 [Neocloeon triangulifer]|uniref:uncharacterized protein LOC132200509 isoform X2 n=1 Tax=Neocloeon triangulifer TaxID=2078957 RepID=UPI00286FA7DE|nr:uncharacterized protein LOC132200509 isoform X2 [Neocloeon triangulifer]
MMKTGMVELGEILLIAVIKFCFVGADVGPLEYHPDFDTDVCQITEHLLSARLNELAHISRRFAGAVVELQTSEKLSALLEDFRKSLPSDIKCEQQRPAPNNAGWSSAHKPNIAGVPEKWSAMTETWTTQRAPNKEQGSWSAPAEMGSGNCELMLTRGNEILEHVRLLKSNSELIRSELENIKSNITADLYTEIELSRGKQDQRHAALLDKIEYLTKKVDQFKSGTQISQGPTQNLTKTLENGKSYLFTEKKFTWDEANKYCGCQGLKLAILNTMDDIQIVSEAAPHADWYHTSGTDMNRKAGEFFWHDGVKIKWHLFTSGDPNDFKDGQETCVFVRSSVLWDYACSYSTYAVCEKQQECENN